jgi:hypothetical protein
MYDNPFISELRVLKVIVPLEGALYTWIWN